MSFLLVNILFFVNYCFGILGRGRIMTKNELSQLYYLNREVEEISKRMATLRYRAKFIKTHTDGKASGALEKEAEKLADVLAEQQKRCFCEQRRLEKFISEVKSSEMRIILAIRYINGRSWQQVAFSVGEHDESYVRKKHDAYLKKMRENSGGKIAI